MAAESTSAMLHLTGHWVGPFQLAQVLGKGAMGVVYLAQDPVLRRSVALKLIAKTTDGADEEHHERFLREARAAARLIHPNVVQIYQVGETLDFRFIAMEYVEGTSLSRAAKQQGGRLGEQFGMERMREAADALQLAETYGISHRDIKPANLLLTQGSVLKIADFGLAGQTDGDTVSMATPGQLEGTPFYMSPEQWSGTAITPAADIYSLGCTFYHLLVGATPYPARDMFGSLQSHCWGPVPDPRSLLPSMDARLAELLEHCMSKRPEDRPTGKQIVEILDEMLLLRRSLVRARDQARPRQDDSLFEETSPTAPYSRAALQTALSGVTPPASSSRSLEPVPSFGNAPVLNSVTHPPVERSYREFYGLRDHPFSDIRQPGFYWNAGPYATALRALAQNVGGGRTCLLMGPAGSGRTFTCEMLQQKYQRLQVFSIEPQLLLGSSILVSLCRQFGVQINQGASLRFLLEAFVSHVVPPTQPDTIVTLVIDGIDPADEDLLRDVTALRRQATRGRVALILVGNEHLANELSARPAGAALVSDTEQIRVRPMSAAEMLEFIAFRMATVGSGRQLELDAASQQLLYARSNGNPKLVSVYCHNALTLAAVLGDQQIRFKALRLAMKSTSYLTPRAALALLQDEIREKK